MRMPSQYECDVFKDIADNIIYDTVVNEKSFITVGPLQIPLPPMNIEPVNYASWIGSNFTSLTEPTENGEKNATMGNRGGSGMKRDSIRQTNVNRYIYIIKIKT